MLMPIVVSAAGIRIHTAQAKDYSPRSLRAERKKQTGDRHQASESRTRPRLPAAPSGLERKRAVFRAEQCYESRTYFLQGVIDR